jgi:hypothetical protein
MIYDVSFIYNGKETMKHGIIYNDILSEKMFDLFIYPDGVYRILANEIISIKESKIQDKKWEDNIDNFYKDTTKNSIIKFVSGKGQTIDDIMEKYLKLDH